MIMGLSCYTLVLDVSHCPLSGLYDSVSVSMVLEVLNVWS